MRQPEFLTIAVPTCERLHFLREAVECAARVEWLNLEILIGDNGSDSATAEWGAEKQREDARIRYNRNARNLGMAGNFNEIARNARGDFIVIIGDDDRLLPGFAEGLMPYCAAGADVAFSNHWLIDGDGERLEVRSREHTRKYGREDIRPGFLERAEQQVWRNVVPLSASIIRRTWLLQFPFSPELNTPEIEVFLKIARAGGRFAFDSAYLADYRVHAGSATSGGLKMDRLANRLVGMDVSSEIEPTKRAFLEPVVLTGVSRCLEDGRMADARRWLFCRYYPPRARFTFKGICQAFCAILPANIGRGLFRILAAIKRG